MMKTLLVLGMTVTLLMGCQATAPVRPVAVDDPYYAPALPPVAESKIIADGSLFHPSSANSIFSDVKARRVGDIISVNLVENTNASKSAGTTTSKESAVNVNPLTGLNGAPITVGGNSLQLGLNSGNEFSGDASTNQSNRLFGNISVTVVDVMPNRNLIIRGEKWLTLNTGDEYIRLTGIIRPEDITPTNEIESTKIANARIQYSGTGAFADTQEAGWLTSFFGSSWWPL